MSPSNQSLVKSRTPFSPGSLPLEVDLSTLGCHNDFSCSPPSSVVTTFGPSRHLKDTYYSTPGSPFIVQGPLCGGSTSRVRLIPEWSVPPSSHFKPRSLFRKHMTLTPPLNRNPLSTLRTDRSRFEYGLFGYCTNTCQVKLLLYRHGIHDYLTKKRSTKKDLRLC